MNYMALLLMKMELERGHKKAPKGSKDYGNICFTCFVTEKICFSCLAVLEMR